MGRYRFSFPTPDVFVLSKVPELGDTIFIVLRKQKLIFLHWYHHISTMWICFYSYVLLSSSCRLYVVMNYTVHSVMYTYYTMKAMKVRVPRALAMLTTSMQLLQMVLGGLITCLVHHYKVNGVSCAVSYEQNRVSFLIYFSYFCLFARWAELINIDDHYYSIL